MRLLYCMLGAPASGKSTFIKKNSLESYTLETDQLRELLGGHEWFWDKDSETSRFKISPAKDKDVWEMLYNLVENRMERGETVFIDATFLFKGAFTRIKKLKNKYHYRVHVVDMRHQVTGATLKELIQHNATQNRIANGADVPVEIIEKYWERETNLGELPKWLSPVTTNTFSKSLLWHTQVVPDNCKVIVFGDIHGCYEALMKAIREVGDPADNPNNIYVFVGDYLDRGIQNDKVFKWLLGLLNLDNVVFLRGNHERHLEHFALGKPIKNRGSRNKTIPQIMRAGVTKKDINNFVNHLQDVYTFSFGDHKLVVVTHAGLPMDILSKTPVYNTESHEFDFKLGLLPEDVFLDGVGGFSTDVDKHNLRYNYPMTTQAGDSKVSYTIDQVHGHRNEFYHPMWYNQNCINLEQRVEMGGKLAVAIYSKGKVDLKEYQNDVYDIKQLENVKDIDLNSLTNNEIYQVLLNSRDIKNKRVSDDIYANNFTREAFQGGRWTNFAITSRGLFTDSEGNVLLRGFPKFFNLDEVPETEYQNLVKHSFPATVTEKYDGFLTLIGVAHDKLCIYTKGGKGIAQEVAVKTIREVMGTKDLGPIKRFFNTHKGVTILCECINPKYDTHMITYTKPAMKVIEAVKNSYSSKDEDSIAEEFANKFKGFELVDKHASINNAQELKDLIDNSKSIHDWYNREGVVLRFADGFRVKIKSQWFLGSKEFKHHLNSHYNRCSNNGKLDFNDLLDKHNNYSYTKKLNKALISEAKKGSIKSILIDPPCNKMMGDLNLPMIFKALEKTDSGKIIRGDDNDE